MAKGKETQLNFDFLTNAEANEKLEELALEAGFSDAASYLANKCEPYIKHPPNKSRSKKKLETNIKHKGGDNAWIHFHNLKNDGNP